MGGECSDSRVRLAQMSFVCWGFFVGDFVPLHEPWKDWERSGSLADHFGCLLLKSCVQLVDSWKGWQHSDTLAAAVCASQVCFGSLECHS